MTTILKIAAISVLASTPPAFAAEMQGAAAALSTASAAADSPSAAGRNHARDSRSAEKTYCLTVQALTGSRIGGRKCKTKEEWLNLGIDVTEKQ